MAATPPTDSALTEPTRPPKDEGGVDDTGIACVAATILYHPDPSRIGEVAVLLDGEGAVEAPLGRLDPVFRTPKGAKTHALLVPEVSRTPLLLRTEGDAVVVRESPGMEATIDEVPLAVEQRLSSAELDRGAVLVLGRAVAIMLHTLEVAPGDEDDLGMVGHSRRMRDLRREIRRVADRDIPVLLSGETGVGKELVAAAIHARSPRRERPYVCVNLAAVPSTVAEAELFGHSRGAFTGATVARQGYFALAEGGTLFLDEVGDTPMDIQAKLLRVTEQREIQPLGQPARKVDVRLIAATDSDLESSVARGDFRRPLLERLGGYRIRLPALRERRDDIPRLFLHFLGEELADLGEARRLTTGVGETKPWLPLSFVLTLLDYPWPGNVRELANVARQVAIANRDREEFRPNEEVALLLARRTAAERPTDPPTGSRHPPTPGSAAPAHLRELAALAGARQPSRSLKRPRELTEDDILAALRAHGFRIQRTAAALNISKSTLYTKMDSSSRLRKAADLQAGELRAALETCGGNVRRTAECLEVSDRALVLRMRQLGLRGD